MLDERWDQSCDWLNTNINENNEKIINNEHEISKLIKVKYQIIKYHQILFPIIIAFQININSINNSSKDWRYSWKRTEPTGR